MSKEFSSLPTWAPLAIANIYIVVVFNFHGLMACWHGIAYFRFDGYKNIVRNGLLKEKFQRY
jgi:hypothetical protein